MALNDPGEVSYVGYLEGPGVSRDFPETNSGIWLGQPGSQSLVVRAGEAAPGAAASARYRFFETNGYVCLNNAGQVAFEASLTSDANGIWAGKPGHLAAVAQDGDLAPGTDGAQIYFPEEPVLNHAGQVAFRSYLGGPGVQPQVNNEALWLWSPDGLSLICRAGDHAPGTSEGVVFRTMISPALNSVGQVAFYASLVGTGVAGDNISGIWATNRDGSVCLVARDGDLLQVGPGDFRRIAELDFLSSSGGEDGRPMAINDLGQVVFRAHFDDGSYGVFIADVPEPATVMLLGVGGLVALRRRGRKESR